MNTVAIQPQTNLYTRLMIATTSSYRAELEAVNGQLRNIERAERMARRLSDIELDARAEAGAGYVPYIVLRLSIDLLPMQQYVVALAGRALERQLVANGQDAQGRDRFQILTVGEERSSLELVVEAI
ncbi:hypothetical protein [Chromobacterium sp. IIBBL 290-4]|uniref:hypothetical protein n=1 Tax=Chromobacterium sp. IIBBL 290-4 TaxID=2953890 RepID=UPI0020B8A221|nr:hypothetical protein [Chromobacterium sp. IIBBL 290-4]UTH73316.1 hypothetical protein NKT35_17515 [Chromobacterium sp. IIBBL 290-4]